MAAVQEDRLKAEYFRLLDDVKGYRAALEAENMNAWLRATASLQKDVNAACTEVFGKSPPSWLLMPWPEAGANARVHAAQSGDLVLLNIGLGNAAHVLGACGALLMAGQGEKAASLIGRLVATHLAGNSPRGIVGKRTVPTEYGQQAMLLSGNIVRYAVSHEYAHILCGHTRSPDQRGLLDVRRRWPTEGAVLWSQRQELEADSTALELLLRALQLQEQHFAPAILATLATLPPLLLLVEHGLVMWAFWDRGRFDVGDGHPPPDARIALLLEAAQKFVPREVLDSMDNCLEWYSQVMELLGVGPGKANK